MAGDENLDVRVRLRGRQKFKQETRGAAGDVDHLGDEIDELGRSAMGATAKLGALGVASSATRVNIGPLSTTARGGALALGGLVNAGGAAIPMMLGVAEAAATVAGGGAAAGGVGLLGIAQGAVVARLALGGLGEALGGSEEAARNLSPELRVLFSQLQGAQEQMRDTAQQGFLPGFERGIGSAITNLPILNKIVAATAKELGGLAEDAGGMLGSQEWGRDLGRLGSANVEIIDDLGHSVLFLADAGKDLLVEAAPLAKWLAQLARDGAENASIWTDQARASGDMARFFRDARRDLMLLGSATGHGSRGLINLFGSSDVDGTRTLRNLDQITARFERWTESVQGEDLGDALIAEIPDLVGAVTTALAEAAPGAGVTFLKGFVGGFMEADLAGKGAIAGLLALRFGLAGKVLGKGGRGGGLMGAIGRAKPVPVWVVNPGGIGGPMPGGKGPGGVVAGGKKLLKSPVGKGGIVAALAYAGFKDAQHLINDVRREADRTRGMSPEDRRAEASRGLQDRVPLSGVRPLRSRALVGADGYPTGDVVKIKVEAPVVTLNHVKLGKLSAQVLARRQAR